MPKIFLPLLAALLLIGAGCGKFQPVPPANIEDNLTEVCFPLRLASGQYIFTAADAIQTLSGAWKVEYDLFIDPEDKNRCAYTLKNPVADYPQIIPQTDPANKFSPADGKTLPELGEAYVERSFLTIRRNGKVINVACNKAKDTACNEDEFLRIGKIIASRWPTNNPAKAENLPAGWKIYRDSETGWSFKYPAEVFMLVSSAPATIQTKYYVVDNPSGMPGKEIIHRVAISLRLEQTGLIDTVKKSPYAIFSQSFPQGTEQSFLPSAGFAEKMTIANRNAYAFTVGVEGTNTRYLYLPRNIGSTLVIKFTFITDFLKDNIKPEPITEQQQQQWFKQVADTISF